MFYLVKCTSSGVVDTIDLNAIRKKRCIVFEKGIRKIEISNYGGFTGKLVFPVTVEKINIQGFYDSYISNFDVIKGNKVYSSENGLLFRKQDQSLLCCPPNYNKEDVIVPKTTRGISTFAFSFTKNVKSVIFDAPVTISGNAFWQSNIQEIIFNDNVGIDVNAFAYAKELNVLCFNKNVTSVVGRLEDAFCANTKLNSVQCKNEQFLLPDIKAIRDIVEGMEES